MFKVSSLAVLLALASALCLGSFAFADNEVDQIPIIGKVQVVEFSGQQPNLDGTVVCTAFGGPELIPPPGAEGVSGENIDFSANFALNGNVWLPTTVDAGTQVFPAGDLTQQLADAWVYAYVIINDEGDSPGGEGGALFNTAQLPLSPALSSIADPFILADGGTRGNYIWAHGNTSTNADFAKPFVQFIPFQAFVFTNFIARQLDTKASGNAPFRSEIFFYYSPFAPSNGDAILSGIFNGDNQAHNLAPRFHHPRWFPEFTCEFGTSIPSPLQPGMTGLLPLTVSNMATSLDPVPTFPADLPGYQLRKLNNEFPSDFVDVSLSSPDVDAGCATIEGPVVLGPTAGTTSSIILVQRDGPGETVNFEVTPAADICSRCDDQSIDIEATLVAQSPYDADPPFEGVPDARIDPDADGVSCDTSVPVECPCRFDFDVKVEFVPDGSNPVCNAAGGFDVDDAPVCGIVKKYLIISADAANTENLIVTSLTDTLPAGLEFIPGSVENANGVLGGNTITFSNIPQIAPGNTLTVCFLARVSPGASAGDVLVNSATAEAECESGQEASPPEITDMATVNVKAPQLTITAGNPSPPRVCEGAPESKTIFTISNPSNGATGWPIDINIPAANGGCLNTSQDVMGMQTLNPGQSVQVSVAVMFNNACPAGLQAVSLGVTGHPSQVAPQDQDCDLDDEDSVQVNVLKPSIDVQCRFEPSPIEDGESATLTLIVRNTSSLETLENVQIFGCVPDAGLVETGSTPLTSTTLAPGETAMATFTYMADLPDGETGPVTLCVSGCSVSGEPEGDAACAVTDGPVTCCITVGTEEIPTLSEWGLILMVLMLGGVMVLRARRA